MAVNVRVVGDVVILSDFSRLMNDPRHFDAARDVQTLVDEGHRKFIIELRGKGLIGPSGIGLLMTITRLVRQRDGDVVLACPSEAIEQQLDELRMDAYWELYPSVDDARTAFETEAP